MPDPESLRARADALVEHTPGEHAALDKLAESGLAPHRHDTRRALLAKADAKERPLPAHEHPLAYPRPERTPDATAEALRARVFGPRR